MRAISVVATEKIEEPNALVKVVNPSMMAVISLDVIVSRYIDLSEGGEELTCQEGGELPVQRSWGVGHLPAERQPNKRLINELTCLPTYFLFMDQLNGCSGSSTPSNSTTYKSQLGSSGGKGFPAPNAGNGRDEATDFVLPTVA